MKTKMNIVLGLVLGLVSTVGFSTTMTHNFATGVSMEAELVPHEPQYFYNFLLWKVKGSCVVQSDTDENPLSFVMITNKGSLNGIEFAPGESLSLVAMAGQRFELIAESRAKVEVVNHGQTTVKLQCSSY